MKMGFEHLYNMSFLKKLMILIIFLFNLYMCSHKSCLNHKYFFE